MNRCNTCQKIIVSYHVCTADTNIMLFIHIQQQQPTAKHASND